MAVAAVFAFSACRRGLFHGVSAYGGALVEQRRSMEREREREGRGDGHGGTKDLKKRDTSFKSPLAAPRPLPLSMGKEGW